MPIVVPPRSDLRRLTVAKRKDSKRVKRFDTFWFFDDAKFGSRRWIEFGCCLHVATIVFVLAVPGFRTGCGLKFDNIRALRGVEPISGVYCVVDPPVPIPNTVVKRFCGDNTGGTSLWEDSTAPDY